MLMMVPCLWLAGCASPLGDVEPTGDDGFLISQPATADESAIPRLKARALKRADEYCASLRKGLEVEDTLVTATQPRSYQVRFRCAALPDPD